MRVEPPVDKVYYKGHFGPESAVPSQSVSYVAQHELRHLQEFRSRALREGREVRNAHFSVDFEWREGRLVAVGGKAEALLVNRPEKGESEGEAGECSCEPHKEGARGAKAAGPPERPPGGNSLEKLLQAKMRLRGKIAKLEQELNLKDSQGEGEEAAPAGARALESRDERERRLLELKEKARRVESLYRTLSFQETAELFKSILGALAENKAAQGLVQAASGVRGDGAVGEEVSPPSPAAPPDSHPPRR
ncbi:MAG: hypothetical protein ACE5LX_08560, partial [Nitrospinota bacterium]